MKHVTVKRIRLRGKMVAFWLLCMFFTTSKLFFLSESGLYESGRYSCRQGYRELCVTSSYTPHDIVVNQTALSGLLCLCGLAATLHGFTHTHTHTHTHTVPRQSCKSRLCRFQQQQTFMRVWTGDYLLLRSQHGVTLCVCVCVCVGGCVQEDRSGILFVLKIGNRFDLAASD